MRSYCENTFKIVSEISEKKGNKSHKLIYHSMLQLLVVYNLSEIESNFLMAF